MVRGGTQERHRSGQKKSLRRRTARVVAEDVLARGLVLCDGLRRRDIPLHPYRRRVVVETVRYVQRVRSAVEEAGGGVDDEGLELADLTAPDEIVRRVVACVCAAASFEVELEAKGGCTYRIDGSCPC